MKRKICVVTGTRAEFGLLRRLLSSIQEASELELQIVATGMHLSPEFGSTFREIEQAGFSIDARVEMLLSADTSTAIAKSVGLGLIGFSDVFERLSPDIVVLLGDRFEMLAAATAALIERVPIAHLHGGELSEGSFDEAIRHSITKMSHFHFVANPRYKDRVIQLGEQPERVFVVGGLGVDALQNINLLSRRDVEERLKFELGSRNLLITYHPVTLEENYDTKCQVSALLSALDAFPDINLVFTMPNSDNGSREIREMIESFVAKRQNSRAYTSLGQLMYLSCMKYVDGVVGNSSSGLCEAPSMKVGTINIGSRQQGRLMADSVINCLPIQDEIVEAINTLYSDKYREKLRSVANPYGTGGASQLIVHILKTISLNGVLKKKFYDIPIVMG